MIDGQFNRQFNGGWHEWEVQPRLRVTCRALGLICFLTAGPDECRARTVRRGAKAPEAAGRIHSDLQRGFIRAEVVALEDLKKHGDEKAAKAAGVYRLEGKVKHLQIRKLVGVYTTTVADGRPFTDPHYESVISRFTRHGVAMSRASTSFDH